jgi:hypothetical protein
MIAVRGKLITIVLSLAKTGFRFIPPQQVRNIMSKGQDSKKSAKKKPLLTAKEKKAAKAVKKNAAGVAAL